MNMEPFMACVVTGIHIPDMQAFYDYLFDTSSKIVAAGKEIERPMVFVLTIRGELALIPTSGTKDHIVAFQKAIVLEPEIRACALVFEAWVSRQMQKDESKLIQASDDPAREEAIIVSIMTYGRQAFTFSIIERPANIVHKGQFKWIDHADIKGRFVL